MAPVGPRKPTNDAEAIREAVSRPTMRFVPMKSAARRAALPDHEAREFPVRRRTRIVDAIQARLSEFGIVLAKGIHDIDRLLAAVEEAPEGTRPAPGSLADQPRDTRDRVATVTARIEIPRREDPLARRLATVPGVTASALAAPTPDVEVFRTGRDYAAWPGLTPKAHSSGGKQRPGGISKAGDRHLRGLLYLGAMACIGARHGKEPREDWLGRVLGRKPVKGVAPTTRARTRGAADRRPLANPYGTRRLGPDQLRGELSGRAGLTRRPDRDRRSSEETVRRET